jgi:exopolysaccharide production protein ExoZ
MIRWQSRPRQALRVQLVQILSIQYLRALAACAVVVFHSGLIFGWNFSIGNAGVDIFFVVSGFIMWLVTQRQDVSPAVFILQRFVRIAPLYWAVTLFLAAAVASRPDLFPGEEPAVWHVVASLLFIPHVAPDGAVRPLLVQGWTLNYEMFFYVLVALGLWLPRRLRLAAIAVTIVVLTLVGAALGSGNAFVATYTSPLLLEFLAGLWLGRAWTRGAVPGESRAGLLLIGGLAMFAASDWVAHDVEKRALFWGVPAVLIVAGGLGLEKRGVVPSIPVLKLLGDASYSIYLAHSFGIMAVLLVFPRVGIAAEGTLPWLATALGGIAAGLLCHLFVERRLTSAVRLLTVGRLKPGLRASPSKLTP